MKQEYINPKNLHFDYRNPRIAEFGIDSQTPEVEIAAILWDTMDVAEIVLSIKASGFFMHEPLIAVRENEIIVIIEGNRRLAAIKYLTDSSFTNLLSDEKKAFVTIPKELKDSLEKIPVLIVEKREEAWKYIGFKHINGAAKWGSYAKAQYISQIKNDYNIPLDEIALQIGDTNKTVKKLYQGLKVIEQAEKADVFDRTDISANRLFFSHLYTALNYHGYKDYVGIQEGNEESESPVPESKIEELGELLNWIFGSKKKKQRPKIESQNPDLRYLEAVLKNKEAVHALRSGVQLSTAYEISQPKDSLFESTLYEIKLSLQKAQFQLTEGYNGADEELLKVAGTIANIADELYNSMETKRDKFIKSQIKKERISE